MDAEQVDIPKRILTYGIVNTGIMPVRAEPNDRSEMVTQALFGERLSVIGQERQWMQVRLSYDDYEGWVDEKQFEILGKNVFELYKVQKQTLALSPVHYAGGAAGRFPIFMGGVLPNYDGWQFTINDQIYSYAGETLLPDEAKQSSAYRMVEFARLYINSPYLWGGRSPFGIDCSGLTQLAGKLAGFQLPRDASQQAKCGIAIPNFKDIRSGDLAFFANKDDKIIHVGIVLDKQSIIHAHAWVRIDRLHKSGIFNVNKELYTHRLVEVRRLGSGM